MLVDFEHSVHPSLDGIPGGQGKVAALVSMYPIKNILLEMQ